MRRGILWVATTVGAIDVRHVERGIPRERLAISLGTAIWLFMLAGVLLFFIVVLALFTAAQ
jgi:hypothetical protein